MLKENSSRIVIISVFWVSLLIFHSCMPGPVKVRIPDCPAPTQNCYSQKWSGNPVYDTIRGKTKAQGYYYVIDRVRGISTPEDEWQLEFESAGSAVLTFSESGINRMMTSRKISVNEFSIERGISGLPESHSGGFSLRKGNAAFTASPARNTSFVKDHGDYVLATLDDIVGKSRIFYGDYKNSQLSDVNEFYDAALDELDWSGHPALSPDGKVMFFVSDKKGGEGGTDIWVSVAEKNGKFVSSYNLGRVINSKCDELSPFVSPDGKRLYFASAGNSSVGGYDIFYSDIYPSFWQNVGIITEFTDYAKYFSVPTNLGYPVNTHADELFPSCPGDCADALYYSSNQYAKSAALVESSGGFDLYVVHKLYFDQKKPEIAKEKPEIAKEKPSDSKPDDIAKKIEEERPLRDDIIIKGGVYDKTSNNPIDSAIISVRSEKRKGDDKDVYSDRFGKFEFPIDVNTQYEITAQKKEYFFDSKRLLFSDDYPQDTADLNFYLPEMGVIRINFPTDEYQNPYKYTLDTNGVETGRYWKDELQLVAGNIMLSIDKIDKIILVGHTDDVGTDEYNIGLGQRRVDFVIEELVKLGIPRDVLFARSAGEREPIIRNKSEELHTYRKRLRRVTMAKFFK